MRLASDTTVLRLAFCRSHLRMRAYVQAAFTYRYDTFQSVVPAIVTFLLMSDAAG